MWPIQNDAKNLKMTETLAHGYSPESTQRGLSNENNMTGFRCFSKIFGSLCFEQKYTQNWKSGKEIMKREIHLFEYNLAINCLSSPCLKGNFSRSACCHISSSN